VEGIRATFRLWQGSKVAHTKLGTLVPHKDRRWQNNQNVDKSRVYLFGVLLDIYVYIFVLSTRNALITGGSCSLTLNPNSERIEQTSRNVWKSRWGLSV